MNLEMALWLLPGLLIGVTVHEFAHAWSASLLGDDFARRQGRVSLNPLRHLSPLGTLAVLVLPFGWGKPVLVNIYNFKRPRWDYFLTSLAGPAANAIVVGLCICLMFWTRSSFRFGDNGIMAMERAHCILMFVAIINTVLATLNLIPIPPLDGSKVWSCLIPAVKPMQRGRTTWLFIVLLLALMYTKSLEPAIELTMGQVVGLFPKSDAEKFATCFETAATAFAAGQWKQAESSFTEALALDPQSRAILLNRATARVQLGEFQGALEDMDQAIALLPYTEADDYRYRAEILRSLGRTSDALVDEVIARSLPADAHEEQDE